ncbi:MULTISPECIES: hypothetical protein [Eisenbergiella]|uniref:hypothetical protein n=1 Tax=Eisenbergiella TaxID=1432051 RepID=UPI0023F15CF6|nr:MULTISPECIES: hypothetical protein [Eisenbergiella]MCI6706922.1 hypothetical protein [Eisenbergiella massiliensis]MDY5527859.1 hypothetical protein [Eisenbergiella porci]
MKYKRTGLSPEKGPGGSHLEPPGAVCPENPAVFFGGKSIFKALFAEIKKIEKFSKNYEKSTCIISGNHI